MGCDIHMFCEELKTIDYVTKWVNVDHWMINPYFGCNQHEEPFNLVGLCDEQHYSMFTALCGVRDRIGGSPKISEPRGVPSDCTDSVLKFKKYWEDDGHSHSYVTLREVKEFVKANERNHSLCELYKLMSERFYKWREPDEIDEDTLDNFRIVFWFDN